ncbi:sulfatase [Parapedobacter composti]|nr:sulfatase [Parapedobacter composti]
MHNKRYNVLLICVDDLMPELGCYGNSIVKSPYIDSLAARSAVFTKHYVTVPTCGASRYSLLRSTLPRTKAALGNEAAKILSDPETAIGNEPETFIEQYRRNGYHTVGIGKISHSPDGYRYPYAGPKSDQRELPRSWDEVSFNPGKWGHGWNAFFAYADGESRITMQGEVPPYEAADVPDEGYPDGLTAALAVDKLKMLARQEKPFFMGVGFFKPHLPFNAPQQYWDLYDAGHLPLTAVPNIPANINLASLHNSAEFNQYRLGEESAALDQPLSDGYARKLIHGYYACISYVDAQVGKVLQALEETGLADRTVVVLWSDHGWHLGDYRVWGKHTLFDRALRSVLMIKTPAMSRCKVVNRITSTIDIGPTLLELCDLPPLSQADGRSLIPLLNDVQDKAWADVAYSYYNHGISMVTPQFRLTRYFRKEQPVIELYDHATDPLETRNIAERSPDIIRQLTPLWERGNTGVYAK